MCLLFFFSSRRRHTRWPRDWSSDVCSSDLPQDVRALAKDVLRHRIVLSYEALAEGVDADRVLDRVLETVVMPQPDWAARAHARAARPRPAARSAPPPHDPHRQASDGRAARGGPSLLGLRRRNRARP